MLGASELEKALKRLVDKPPGWSAFDKRPAVGGRPGAVTTGRPASAGQSGAAVALEESDYALREYWAPRTLQSSDGLFVWHEEPIKRIVLTDGVPFLFADPPIT